MAFVNLLTVLYPVGAVYISKATTSPSSLIGGTWSKVTDGLLAAAGSTGFAANGGTGGSLYMTVNQMPSHYHSMTLITYSSSGTQNPHTYPQGALRGSLYDVSSVDDINHPEGGVLLTRSHTSPSMFGFERHRMLSPLKGGDVNGVR